MAYTAPSLSELRKLVEQLEKEYKNTNPQRLSFLTLLKTVIDATAVSQDSIATKVILGALILEMGLIEDESYFAPRATMYALLKKSLNITKDNQLGDDERLIYTHALYDHINKLFSDNTIQFMREKQPVFIWKNKDSLLQCIHDRMKAIRKRDTDRIDRLVHARPGVEALRDGTKKLAREYQKMARAQQGSWFFKRDVRRDELTNFIDLVDKSCDVFYQQNIPADASEQFRRKLINDECETRRGLLLFALLQISKQYKMLSPEGGWFTSGSQLFKETLQILNVDHLEDISPEEKTDLLKALQTHLNLMRENPAEWKAFLDIAAKCGIIPLNTDKELYLDKIQYYKVEQDKQKYDPQGRSGIASTAVGYATQSTTTYALSTGAGSYVVKGMVGAAAMSLGGVPAVAVYAGGTLLISGLSSLVGERIVTAVTTNLYEWLLDKVGASVGSVAAGIVNLSNDVSNETIYALRMKLKPEDEKLFCDWVNTLLELPLDIVSEKEKICIRKVLGLDPECMLLPLHEEISTSKIRMSR